MPVNVFYGTSGLQQQYLLIDNLLIRINSSGLKSITSINGTISVCICSSCYNSRAVRISLSACECRIFEQIQLPAVIIDCEVSVTNIVSVLCPLSKTVSVSFVSCISVVPSVHCLDFQLFQLSKVNVSPSLALFCMFVVLVPSRVSGSIL